ncbi:DUF1501 domain-containing protein [Yoonia sp. F2084L]|nr:DUF1501 domain-containing protein [Yoonia sp. F2084L]MCK0094087.1 DUF1501 domain-containing protein [Yoonia sp. F2084L]
MLNDLTQSIASFSSALPDIGLWDRVSIVTLSEFGRTARENAPAGTDHGTAAALFIAGGSVKYGLSGERPSLTALVEEDLVHTPDHRTVSASLLKNLWQIDSAEFDIGADGIEILVT